VFHVPVFYGHYPYKSSPFFGSPVVTIALPAAPQAIEPDQVAYGSAIASCAEGSVKKNTSDRNVMVEHE
jgi:hypothetical protein